MLAQDWRVRAEEEDEEEKKRKEELEQALKKQELEKELAELEERKRKREAIARSKANHPTTLASRKFESSTHLRNHDGTQDQEHPMGAS